MTELDYITEAAERFYKEAGFVFEGNMKGYYESLIDSGTVFVEAEIGKGFVVGFIAPSFLEPTKRMCSELAWYVEPEYRGTSVAIRLMKRYEQRAKDTGCDFISMVALEALDPEKTGAIYERLGYTKLEHHYRKEL